MNLCIFHGQMMNEELNANQLSKIVSSPCVGAWDGFHVHVASKLKFSIASKTNTQLAAKD